MINRKARAKNINCVGKFGFTDFSPNRFSEVLIFTDGTGIDGVGERIQFTCRFSILESIIILANACCFATIAP